MSLTCLLPYLQILLLMCDITHALQHLLCLIILRTVLPPPQSHPPCHGIPGAGSWTNVYKDADLSLQEMIKMYAKKETTKHTVVTNTFIHSYLEAVLPPPAAATVAGEAPARRSWFCREKSMLYHSAARSTGLGGITRLGFSRTSSTYRERRECVCECVSGRDSFPKLQQGKKKKTKAYLINHLFVTRSITILICLRKISLHSSISLHSLLKLLPGLSLQS